ncbi:methylmalonyl-CoA mutase family protein, partial [Hansschlegelia beijingensis]
LAPGPVHVHAETSRRMMTQRDAHTNMVRTTIAAFAAGVGGADSIVVLPYTHAFGASDADSRRLARNAQSIILEESNAYRVADPAAGAGAIELLTDKFAEAGWRTFREIERQGGLFEALRSGFWQTQILEIRAARAEAVATVRRVGSSGGSGDGGAVNVSLLNDQSTITTAGVGAHGVVAQSVGGGGGMVANFRPDDVPSLTSEAWFTTGGSGRGGAVTVLSLADIHVSGAGAFGIVAQSAGGGGLVADDGKFYAGGVGDGGALKLTLQNRIAATGEGGIGVFAQSTGAQGGAIEVNLGYYKPAAITGGSGAQGAGVVIDSRADSHMYVGEGSQISALSGTAIRSVSGRVDVQNDGAIYGNTYLTGGTIYGAPQIPGQPPSSTALAGVERGVLTNSGTLVASAGGAIIDGDLVQTASGRVAATFDFVAGQSASYLVAGDARLDGKIAPVLASVLPGVRVRALEVQGVATGSLSVEDSPLFSFALHQSGGTYDVSVREAHFAGPDFGLSAHRKDVAEALEAVFESGRPELGALFAGLKASNVDTIKDFVSTDDTIRLENKVFV